MPTLDDRASLVTLIQAVIPLVTKTKKQDG
jgi:hypothetical protein